MHSSVLPKSVNPPAEEAALDIEAAKQLQQSPIIPEILESLVESATLDLCVAIKREQIDVAESVRDGLVEHFRQTLARITNAVAAQRYTSFHLVINPLWRPIADVGPGAAHSALPRTMLDAYVRWEEIEKVLAPEGPFPALAQLAASVRDNWLSASVEVLQRVERHRESLAGLLGLAPGMLGRLTGITFGVSDPHNDGRTVAMLAFGAQRLVYKPRPLDAEIAWNALYADVVEAVSGEAARIPGIASFGSYGFMEFIEAVDCPDAAAVQRGYFRYGILTAVAHALGSVDLHHENVVMAGEHPVAIDCEPLFRARLATSDFGVDRLEIERNLSLSDFEVRESVLELGILPTAMEVPALPDRDGQAGAAQELDIGALCAYAIEPYKEILPCGLGTDRLHMRPHPIIAKTFPNLPTIAGRPILPTDHVEDIVAGFEAAHRYLVDNAERYTRAGGWLDRQGNISVRLLARPTMDYMHVLGRSLAPQSMRSTDLRLDQIRRDLAALAINRMDAIGEMAASEADSLVKGDVPFFTLRAGAATCSGTKLHASPIEAARTRWQAMDVFDRTVQVGQIREQLLRRDQAVAATRPQLADAAGLERHALEIVDSLARSVCNHEGAPGWVYASYAPGVSSTMAHMDREALYEGAAGTAVALAEAGAISGRADWLNLATGVFRPFLGEGRVPLCVKRGCGLGRGLGGLVYAMTRVARASGNEELLDAALRLVLDYGPGLAEREALDELLYGRAGLLLALTALYRNKPDRRLLALSDLVAHRIKSHARCIGDMAYWPSPNGREMSNPSHGSSGVGMALARWTALSGDDAAGRLALDALRHDDRFWVEDERGWADGRFQDVQMATRCNWSWCNGRSGGLLARAATAEALRQSVPGRAAAAGEAALADILTDVSPGLCCGTAGAVDALLAVCAHGAHGQVAGHARTAVSHMALHSPTSHYLTLSGSLFSGTAGLAFALLRAARPDQVESLLWFH